MIHVASVFIQAINAAALEDVERAAEWVLCELQRPHNEADEVATSGPKESKPSPVTTAISAPTLDGVAALYAEAVRCQCDGKTFREALGSLHLQHQKATVLSDAYDAALEGLCRLGIMGRMRQSFLPHLTGVSWSLSHELGDRTGTPITPSVPVFDFVFTGNSCATRLPTKEGNEVLARVTCTSGQAEDLLETLRDMLTEAERLTRPK
ncbi:hypothetical protein MOQ_005788 [Trypanosoma cruzi marinkellei]|uniref:COMM domain-containing protein n=1 Tax=Trypanosoma cruzi marinkellei TaxID=85056 RepID=K2M644_TRYCR|nr:hypothetical protein MOQ_005788 [Trypanosoma cruzi marinkellei]